LAASAAAAASVSAAGHAATTASGVGVVCSQAGIERGLGATEPVIGATKLAHSARHGDGSSSASQCIWGEDACEPGRLLQDVDFRRLIDHVSPSAIHCLLLCGTVVASVCRLQVSIDCQHLREARGALHRTDIEALDLEVFGSSLKA